MALMKCIECGKEFSSFADACPNCGCPTNYIRDNRLLQQDNVLEVKPTILSKIDEEGIDVYKIIRENWGSNTCSPLDEYKKVSNKNLKEIKKILSEYYRDLHITSCYKCKAVVFEEDSHCYLCGTSREESISIKDIKESLIDSSYVSNFVENVEKSPSDDSLVKCPRCSSTQIATKTKGFRLGKAVIGGLLVGPIGLLGGSIGSNKTLVVCLKCGKEWKV